MELDLAPGESRGYWKYHTPGKWFKQAKAVGKINNEKATMLFDSGAEVSIVDTTFARKVGCVIDESQRQEGIGIGENTYMTEGRTKIKITLNGSLVYYFDAWVSDQVGQEAILNMDFMVPAGIRLDLADGTLCLPDEVRIQLAGRRPPYQTNRQPITINDQYVVIPVGGSTELRSVPVHRILSFGLVDGCGYDTSITWICLVLGSRRYNEWQTMAYEAREKEFADEPTGPLIDHPSYSLLTKILMRPRKGENEKIAKVEKIASQSDKDTINVGIVDDNDQGQSDRVKNKSRAIATEDVPTKEPSSDEAVYSHESGDLLTKDVNQHMAVLPEIVMSTVEISIDDIQVGDPEIPLTEEQEKLRQLIWKNRHLLIGKGNALPPAARGAICDIDVGGANPIAQNVRPVAPKFREI
ncbi:unnamed protein product [Peronospora effusa]|nr:unnamed protein product [Peronospora effusa]